MSHILATICGVSLLENVSGADVLEDYALAHMPKIFWEEQNKLLNVVNLPDSKTAYTKHGPVTGFRRTDFGWQDRNLPQEVDSWWGVRFAPEPERFRPATDLPDDFEHYPTAREQSLDRLCIQPDLSGKETMGSEDCLFLDIVAPVNATGLPVMFWIYGGGYNHGDSWEFGFYNAAALASQRNMVIVKVNYRLGALGFWASDYLRDTNEHKTTGNQGVQDQRQGLKWVSENIEAFGGDPKRVTIVGESAGAFSINWHLAAKESFQYFHQAVSMSGINQNSLFYPKYEDSTRGYKDLGILLGCDHNDLTDADVHKCLEKVPAKEYVMAVQRAHGWLKKGHQAPDPTIFPKWSSPLFPRMGFGPTIDNSTVGYSKDPMDAIYAGEAAKVPLMIGSNTDGGSLFVPSTPMTCNNDGGVLPITNSSIYGVMSWWVPNQTFVDSLLDTYPPEDFAYNSGISDWFENSQRYSRIIRDFIFMCPIRRVLNNWTQETSQPVWTYVWNQKFDGIAKFLRLNTYHASELDFLFENWYWFPRWTPFGKVTEEKQKVATAIQCYWANFVHNGDPSKMIPECENKGLNDWSKFESGNEKYLDLGIEKGKIEEGNLVFIQPEMRHVSGKVTPKYPADITPGDDRCDLYLDGTTPVWHDLYGSDTQAGRERWDTSSGYNEPWKDKKKAGMSWLKAMGGRIEAGLRN